MDGEKPAPADVLLRGPTPTPTCPKPLCLRFCHYHAHCTDVLTERGGDLPKVTQWRRAGIKILVSSLRLQGSFYQVNLLRRVFLAPLVGGSGRWQSVGGTISFLGPVFSLPLSLTSCITSSKPLHSSELERQDTQGCCLLGTREYGAGRATGIFESILPGFRLRNRGPALTKGFSQGHPQGHPQR